MVLKRNTNFIYLIYTKVEKGFELK